MKNDTKAIEAKHTPGPWRAGTKADMPRCDADLIKPVPGYSYISSGPWLALARACVKIEGERGNNPEGLANARLIADAPAMRLALEAVSAGVARVEGREFCFNGMRYSVRDGDWSGSFTTFGLWDKLPAAISKATGGVA